MYAPNTILFTFKTKVAQYCQYIAIFLRKFIKLLLRCRLSLQFSLAFKRLLYSITISSNLILIIIKELN